MKWHWTPEERRHDDEALSAADLRLEAWGVWARTSGISTAYAVSGLQMAPEDDEEVTDTFTAEPELVIIDEECEQIDRFLAEMVRLPRKRGLFKIAHVEYRTYGPQIVKCRRANMSRLDYRVMLERLQDYICDRLGL